MMNAVAKHIINIASDIAGTEKNGYPQSEFMPKWMFKCSNTNGWSRYTNKVYLEVRAMSGAIFGGIFSQGIRKNKMKRAHASKNEAIKKLL